MIIKINFDQNFFKKPNAASLTKILIEK